MGRFRAPTLRNIAVAAIAHYASGGRRSPFKSQRLKGFALSRRDTADLVAFLESLTDPEFLINPDFGPPAR